MMTSPYCVSATDYARDLYAGAAVDATLRQHSGLALRHGPVHGAGAIYRQTPYSDVKFERGGDASVYEVGPTGAAAGMCWTSHDMYASSSATLRTNHRVGHSFPSVSLDGSTINAAAWHTFPSYVQPCKYINYITTYFDGADRICLAPAVRFKSKWLHTSVWVNLLHPKCSLIQKLQDFSRAQSFPCVL